MVIVVVDSEDYVTHNMVVNGTFRCVKQPLARHYYRPKCVFPCKLEAVIALPFALWTMYSDITSGGDIAYILSTECKTVVG